MHRVSRAAGVLGIPTNGISSTRRCILLSILLVSGFLFPSVSNAAALTLASVALSDTRPSQTSVTYSTTASSYSGGTVKCIKELFATTPSGSTKPTGMVTASGITIAGSQTLLASTAGWTRGGTDPDGTVTFTNASSSEVPSGTKAWNLSGFTNSSISGTSYWLTISTYGNIDCVTSPADRTITGFIITTGSLLSFSVDQSLSFSISGVATATGCDGTTTNQTSTASTLPFGVVNSATNGVVCQDLTAATNATSGYTIYLRYTGQLSNGNGGFIADQTGTNASPTVFSAPGTASYGYTTNDSSLGTGIFNRFTNVSQKWAAATTSNQEVVYEPSGLTTQTYRIGHQVGISTVTSPGNYTSTIIYTCTPIY